MQRRASLMYVCGRRSETRMRSISRTKGSTLDDTLTGNALVAQPSFDANLMQLMLER
jgi:hypothetical protein